MINKLMMLLLLLIVPISAQASLILDIDFNDQVLDQTGLHTTTNNGVTYSTNTPQGSDKSGNFTAASSYITITDAADLDLTAFTMCWWANPYDMTGTHNVYNSRDGSGDGIQIRYNSGKLFVTLDNINGEKTGISTVTAPNESWSHWCVRRNDTKFAIYKNAVVNNITTPPAGLVPNVNDVTLGRKIFLAADQYIGLLDDFQLYNTALSDAEINDIYTNVKFLEITAEDYYASTDINNFNVTFTNGSFFSTTDGNITLINWTNGNYTFTIRSLNYAPNTSTINHNNISRVNIPMFPDNSIAIRFAWEDTQEYIDDVVYEIISDSFYGTFNTTNSTSVHSGLPTGDYEIRYGLEGNDPYHWTARSYYFFVPIVGTLGTFGYNVTLYLANSTDTDAFLPVVRDENQNPIPNSYIQALRYYVDTNSYEGVEMARPDGQIGQSLMNLYFNTVYYKFRVYQGSKVIYEDSTPFRLVDQTLQFTINVNPSVLFEYSGCNNLQSNLTYLPGTDTFRWSYNDVNNAFDQYCLYVRYRRGLTDNLTTSCDTSTSGIRLITIDAAQNGTFTATAIASSSGGSCVVDVVEYQNEPPGVAVLGLLGVFAGLIGVIVAFFLTLENPGIGILLGLAVLAAMSGAFLGFGIFSITAVTTLIIIGIILIYVTKV